MKKFILILVTSIWISFYLSAQSAGDYRTVGSGNWNDPTNWEIYNGSNWVTAIIYPGQNDGTGKVTILNGTEIKITTTVPNSIASLKVGVYIYDEALPRGVLAFSAENAVSLSVSGNIQIAGSFIVEDQIGAKSHSIFVGGDLEIGTPIYDLVFSCPPIDLIPATFYTINWDDKLNFVFNGYSRIYSGPNEIEFQDITFNGTGFTVVSPVLIKGNASFIKGIVTIIPHSDSYPSDCDYTYLNNGSICFIENATASGGSNISFIDGIPSKIGASPFTFPIGDEGFYAPVTISAIAQPEKIYASYNRDGSWPISVTDPELFSISSCEYLHVFRDDNDAINSFIDVTVGWTSPSRCDSYYIASVSDIVLTDFDGYTWSSHRGVATGTSTNGSITWSGFDFGPFTLGNVGGCTIPSGLSSSNITSNSATLNWAALSGAISYDVEYKLYYSNEWINAARAVTTTFVNVSNLNSSSTYKWRVRANCNLSSSSYREDQFTTRCGVPSSLTTNTISFSYVIINWSPVSNANTYYVQYKQSSATIWINTSGTPSTSTMLAGLSASTSYDWRVSASCYSDQGDFAAQASFTTSPSPCNDVYEPNNTSSQAKTIALGNTISALISSSVDFEWFKITTPNSANNWLEITLSNLETDYDLFLYDKRLKLLVSSTNAGTSNEVVTYSSNARKADYYIKVIGKNGAYNTSQCYNLLAQVRNSPNSALSKSYPANEVIDIPEKELLYPNPASEFVYLNFFSATKEQINIQIVNSVGQLVKQHPVITIKGHNQFKIHVNDIRPGIYILKISKGELNLQRKFVIGR